MSLPYPEPPRLSRRAYLRWTAAALAAAPFVARADVNCPCAAIDPDDKPNSPPSKVSESPVTELRVCADPNNLPFSNRNREGFEDKIVAVVARDLGLPLTYEWLPQRLGFYRTALKTFDSNLVMAAPAGFDKALITQPYYRSSFVFVQRADAADHIHSFDDPGLRSVKIGVQLTGGVNAPPTHALARRNIIDNVTGFPVFDESNGKPAEKIINAVAGGQIDLAIVWGAQAGYFARQQSVPLALSPVAPDHDVQGDARMPFTFEICMALRRPDRQLRDRINAVIASRHSEINQILDRYGVCRLPLLSPADKQPTEAKT